MALPSQNKRRMDAALQPTWSHRRGDTAEGQKTKTSACFTSKVKLKAERGHLFSDRAQRQEATTRQVLCFLSQVLQLNIESRLAWHNSCILPWERETNGRDHQHPNEEILPQPNTHNRRVSCDHGHVLRIKSLQTLFILRQCTSRTHVASRIKR